MLTLMMYVIAKAMRDQVDLATRVQADLATTAQVAPATQVLAAEGIAHPSVNDLGLAERNSLSALILVSHG